MRYSKTSITAEKEYSSVHRTSDTYKTDTRTDREQVALRAAWAKERLYMHHALHFSRNATPKSKRWERVSFSDGFLPDSEALRDNDARNTSVAASGYYNFSLPKGNSLTANWTFNYTSNSNNTRYTLGNLPTVVNLTDEKVYSPDITLYYSKRLAKNNMVNVMLASTNWFYDTSYHGSFNNVQSLTSSENFCFVEYMQYWGFGLSFFGRAGTTYLLGRLNGTDYLHQWNPRLGVSLDYSLNSKNRLNLDGWWNNSSPNAATTNSALVQSTELLWIMGNPYLKPVYGPNISLSYSFIPTNKFNLSAVVKYDRYNRVPTYLYLAPEDFDGLVRTYSDDNAEEAFTGRVAANLKLFNNQLNLSGAVEFHHEALYGCHPLTATYVTGTANVAWYYRNFNVSLLYQSPSRSIMASGGALSRYEAGYALMANYSIGDFHISAAFRNWFNSGRIESSYDSAHYSSEGWRWANGRFKNVELILSYTFRYGKKVKEQSSLDSEVGGSSAIMLE